MILQKTYQQLPSLFFSMVRPRKVKAPITLLFNSKLAAHLGIAIEEADQVLSGNQLMLGSEPIAQAYAGHQFGHFNILGDGRAHLLGEFVDLKGFRWDLQLKGSGPTPYSRGGDGLAALGPMLREYLISEAMAALGVPTTRSLAVTATGEIVLRDKPHPGAVLARIAASHIRVGTFEFAAISGGGSAVKALADYCIQRHFIGDLKNRDEMENPYLLFLRSVIERQARLIAQWMNLGFIHGVMNTDNMTISGETIDYGPCAFMDLYDPATVFSSIDHDGRYSFGNQPAIALWNLARFAEALLPVLAENEPVAIELAQQELHSFNELFQDYYLSGLRTKMGLTEKRAGDEHLIAEFFKILEEFKMDFSWTFYCLSRTEKQSDDFFNSQEFKRWHEAWLARLAAEGRHEEAYQLMNATNPVIVPRNYWVERALAAAVDENNFDIFRRLLNALENPYVETESNLEFQKPPETKLENYKTFCGT